MLSADRYAAKATAQHDAAGAAIYERSSDNATLTALHLLTSVMCRVNAVEHLLSALEASGVNNARIEIRGDEVPFLDGSARPFVRLIHLAGTVPAPAQPSKPTSTTEEVCTKQPCSLHDLLDAHWTAHMLSSRWLSQAFRASHPLAGTVPAPAQPDKPNSTTEEVQMRQLWSSPSVKFSL